MNALTIIRGTAESEESLESLRSRPTVSNVYAHFKGYLWVGFLSSLMVALGSLQQRSPFTSKVVGSWWLGIASPQSVPSNHFRLLAEVAVVVGLVLGCIAWLALLQKVRKNPGIPVRAFWYIAAAWVVPLAIAGPLFSKDIYSYAALGEMVSHHISPYNYGPNVLGGTPYLTTVDPFWGNAKTPYGPFFLGISWLITTLTLHHAFATMIGLRVLALVSGIVIAIYIPRLAGLFGFDKGVAFTLAVLSPVTIYHLISAGHNDVLMLALLLAGLYYAKLSRPILGIVLVTLAALVKVPAEIGVLYIGWTWLGDQKSFKDRIRPVVSGFVISAIVMELVAKITGLGWGWILALSTPGQVRSPAVPTTALASGINSITGLLGFPIHMSLLLSITRVLGFAISGIGCLYFLFRYKHFGALKAIAYSFLVVTLFAPVIQPWYIAWGLIILAAVPSPRIIWGIVYVSFAAMILGLPGGPPIIAWMGYIALIVGAALYLAVKFNLVPKERVLSIFERVSSATTAI